MNEKLTAIQPSTAAVRHRFHLLDGLRGLAAIMVAIWHGQNDFHSTNFVANGPLAVDFFFCLSGFVIAFSYEKRLEQNLKARNFFMARIIRLYPLCFLGMTIGFCLATMHNIQQSNLRGLRAGFRLYLESFFLFPNIIRKNGDFLFPLDPAAWSLLFELAANAVYAMLVRKRAAQNWVLLVIAIISFFCVTYWIFGGRAIWEMGWQNQTTSFLMGAARTALSFTTGILIFRFYRHRGKPCLWPVRFGAAISFIVTGCLLLILISPIASMQSGIFPLAAITFVMPAVVFLGATTSIPKCLNSLCTAFGELSYPLYLIHMPILGALSLLLRPWIQRPSSAIWIVSTTVTLIALLSLAVAKWIDAPVRFFLLGKYDAFVSSRSVHANQ